MRWYYYEFTALSDWSDFLMTLKNGFGKCFFLFSQSMDEKIKYGLFVFSPKKTLTWRRYCSTGQSCCSMTSKRSNAPERSLNQPKATPVCIRSINQSNRSICVVVCCFCFVCAFSFQGHTKIALSIHNQEKSLRKSIRKCFDLLSNYLYN